MAFICFAVGFVAFLMSANTETVNAEVNDLSRVDSEMLKALAAHNQWKSGLEATFVEHLEELAPEAGAHLEEVGDGHLDLHDSTAAIDSAWEQRHIGLSEELQTRLLDHHAWASRQSGLDYPPSGCKTSPFG